MTTTVGQVKVVELAYDNKGKSKGIATVIFRQKGSAQKAFEQCTSVSPPMEDGRRARVRGADLDSSLAGRMGNWAIRRR